MKELYSVQLTLTPSVIFIKICSKNVIRDEKINLKFRAQVLIQAKAYNFALHDIRKVLLLDPTHEKTLLRMAHCYETIDATKTLEVWYENL